MNLLVVAPLAAWFIAQLIKFATSVLRGNVDFKLFWQSGGMPSSHTSIVVALATTSLAVDGASSPTFAVALILALIVVYDATGVRRSVQMMSPVLTQLAQRDDIAVDEKLLLIRGHTNREVLYGIVTGIVVGGAFTTSYWSHALSSWEQLATGTELLVQAVALAIMMVIGVGLYAVSKKGSNSKLPSYSRLRRAALWSLVVPAFVGALLLLARSETISLFSWRVWPWLVLVSVATAQLTLAKSLYRDFKSRVADEREHFLKKKKVRKSRKKSAKKRSKKAKRKR